MSNERVLLNKIGGFAMTDCTKERWNERSCVKDCRCGARHLVTERDGSAQRSKCALCGASLGGAEARLVDDFAAFPLVRAAALAEADF